MEFAKQLLEDDGGGGVAFQPHSPKLKGVLQRTKGLPFKNLLTEKKYQAHYSISTAKHNQF